MMIDTLDVNRRQGFSKIAVAIFATLSLTIMPNAGANSNYENCVDDADAAYDDGVEAAESRLASMGYTAAGYEIFYSALQRLADALASELSACEDLRPPVVISLPVDPFDDNDDEEDGGDDDDECCGVSDPDDGWSPEIEEED